MEPLDFNQEAARLRAALGIDGSSPHVRYHEMDKIWQDGRTGGAIFVGNESAAQDYSAFERHGISHVVNCTDDMPHFFEGQGLSYMRFDVARHYLVSGEPEHLANFVGTLFAFVDNALARGQSVLVHCLAGAHRAGTVGCLLLMHKDGLSADESVAAAQSLRPIINPIGQLPLLLQRFGAMLDDAHEVAWAEAEAARQAQVGRAQKQAWSEASQPRAAPRSKITQVWARPEDDGRGPARAPQALPGLHGARGLVAVPAAEEEDEDEDDDEEGWESTEPTLNQCVAALGFIARRAHYAVHDASRHSRGRPAPGEEDEKDEEAAAQLPNTPRTEKRMQADWAAMMAEEETHARRAARGGDEEDDEESEEAYAYEEFESADDFEEFEEEEEPRHGWEDDLADLRAAVDESRQAVKEVEARLHRAEASEPQRDAIAQNPIGAPLVASVASALGVPRERVARALRAAGGNLEKALDELAPLVAQQQ